MFRRTCGELLVRFLFCVRGYGRGGRPAFPAPSSLFEGRRSTARAHSRRENAKARHCERSGTSGGCLKFKSGKIASGVRSVDPRDDRELADALVAVGVEEGVIVAE